MSSMHTSLADRADRPQPYLEVRDVTAGYGGAPVVSEISVTVGRGEVVSVLGPNGAGKSTLLKVIVGGIKPTEGSVRLAGEDVTGASTDALVRRGLGYVPQDKDVFGRLTVLENLRVGGYILDKAHVEERVGAVLDLFPSLKKMLKRHASKLSGGERKLLAIARVLMLSPALLVLDEPSAGLSPQLGTKLLTEHVSGLAAQGNAVLLVEQRAAAALDISDWAYVLVSGRTSVSGKSTDLLAQENFAQVFLGQAAG